jgi:hypothetical protein
VFVEREEELYIFDCDVCCFVYFYQLLRFCLLCLTRQCVVMRVECGTVLALASEDRH